MITMRAREQLLFLYHMYADDQRIDDVGHCEADGSSSLILTARSLACDIRGI